MTFDNYTHHGHKLRFSQSKKAQFVTVKGIVGAIRLQCLSRSFTHWSMPMLGAQIYHPASYDAG